MRLVDLSANMPSFQSVSFNPSGLSLIVAEQRSPKASKTSTYNGVGKSLMLELIHFCLGSNAKKAFQKHLPGWTFILTIEIDGDEHTISRSTDNKELALDGKKVSLPSLREFLEKAASIFLLSCLIFPSAP